jgi:hypothetical protein
LVKEEGDWRREREELGDANGRTGERREMNGATKGENEDEEAAL